MDIFEGLSERQREAESARVRDRQTKRDSEIETARE